jgi:two-component sensor histidine kinase
VLIRKEINVSIAINIDISVSLGLITSELIINSFKHAFVKENENVLTINLEEKEEGCYALIIRDNGGGLPPDYENSQKESLGMDLVKILTEQINGTLDYKFEKGAVFTINFKA